jgi:hypothetical protein
MEPEGSLPCSQQPEIPRPCVTFRNKLVFLRLGVVSSSFSKLEDHPLSAFRDWLNNMFAAILHI